jgi:hypothetical protein
MAEKIRVSLGGASAEPLNVKLNSAVSSGKVTMPLPTIVQSHKVEISDTPTEGGTSAFSTGGAFNLQEQINKKANKEDIPTIPNIPTKLSELENDKEFATKTEVDEAIRDNTPDLTPYVTDETLNATLEDYAKSTDIPSVEGLASESYVNGIVGDINRVLDQINGEVI